MKQTLSVQGMSCGHCKMTVETAVKALRGVKKASVSLESASITIEYDEGKLTEDKIRTAIRNTGYDVG